MSLLVRLNKIPGRSSATLPFTIASLNRLTHVSSITVPKGGFK